MLVLIFATLQRFGLIGSIIHRIAEEELSKLCNGAKVTITNLEVDILTGRIHATDVIVHTPLRDEWNWDSPLISRIGKIYVHVSMLSMLDESTIIPLQKISGYWWKDIHEIYIEDIQVFVEKRKNVFNFNLLDPSLEIPDPPVTNSSRQRQLETIAAENLSAQCPSKTFQMQDNSPRNSSLKVSADERHQSDLAHDPASDNNDETAAQVKANEIVTSMLKTVSTLGKAANEGGKEGLERAFMFQKEGINNRLREISARVKLARKGESVEQLAIESMKVIRQVGKTVEKNVTEIHQSLKPPGKKKGYVTSNQNEIWRVGRIVGRDIRIFTKDVILSRSNNGNGGKPNELCWNKPILLKEVVMSGTELSPSITERDENGMPPIGLKLTKIQDILLKKLFGEMAKTNSGRLLKNTFGEVFAWMDLKTSITGSDKINM